MTAQEMWNQSGLTGEYDAWSFGDDADTLARLVKDGIKTATCSAYCFYELEKEDLPEQPGDCGTCIQRRRRRPVPGILA